MLTSLFLFWQAFTMIDQNRDGFIDANDLKEMFSSLGKQWLSEPTSFVLSSWLCVSDFLLYIHVYSCLRTFLAREHMKWQFGRLLSGTGVCIAARANSISTSCVVPCTNHYHMHSLSASGTRPNSSQKRTWHRIFSIITKPINSWYRHIITFAEPKSHYITRINIFVVHRNWNILKTAVSLKLINILHLDRKSLHGKPPNCVILRIFGC